MGPQDRRVQGRRDRHREAQARIASGANAIMELGRDQNIDGFDNGNGAAPRQSQPHRRELLPSLARRRRRFGWSPASRASRPARSWPTDFGSDFLPAPKGERAE